MKVCNRCIVNSSVPSFIKYKKGCSYCIFSKKLTENKYLKKFFRVNIINRQNKVKSKNKKYDCIVGLSGEDSAWALMKAKEAGLNPLAVHMDNGGIPNLLKIIFKLF